MSRKRIFAPVIIVLATTLGACGSDGGNKASFSDQLQDACRSITRDLRDIDEPATLDDVQKAADDASSVYTDGLAALKKLKAPSKQSSDFDALQANVNDEIDLFDQISAAAKKADDKTVTSKISSLKKLEADDSDLADSLDASSCAFPAVLTAVPTTATTTPETTPVDTTPVTDAATTVPATEPATTLPATTLPPETLPPLTNPATTAAPVTTAAAAIGEKQIVQRAAQLSPVGDYTFVDSPAGTVTSLQSVMNLSPVVAPQTGLLFGIDVIVRGIVETRVISFVANGDLTAGSAESLQTTFASGAEITQTTIAGVTGGEFTVGDNLFFVAADNPAIVVVVAKDQASLEEGFTDFAESVQAG